jgi:putative ubiquitin-RnfH superfamily antitoxin RatB of RatAB toxin-antitoxin module
MRVSVAYADLKAQFWQKLNLPDGATVRDAIEKSGVLGKFPQIDLEKQKVGVFGKVTPLDTALNEGDRVEIYRAIIVDPRSVPRKSGAKDDD